jgi:hypothetical protein
VFGRRVAQGPVLYIAAEDGHGLQVRVRALRQVWGDAPAFRLCPEAVDLREPEARHLCALRQIVAELRPTLVVIDTLARAFPGLRENDSDEMSRVVQLARELTGICGSAVLLMHHVPKDGGTPRGHGVLNGDADAVLVVEGSAGQPRTVRFGKNRNGASDGSLNFVVRVQTLGSDDDGDPITAVITEEIAATAATDALKKEGKLKDEPAVLLREARGLIAEQGEWSTPESGMPLVHGVRRAVLRQRLIVRGWFSEHLLRTASNGQPGLLRPGYVAENHTLTTLKRAGLLGFNREWTWLL